MLKIILLSLLATVALTACGAKKVRMYDEAKCQRVQLNGSVQLICEE